MSRHAVHIVLVLMLLAGAGCDNVVDPISDDRNGSVAMYGVLDMRTERQLLRLEALRSTIEEAPGELQGVDVRSIEEATGSIQTWTRLDTTDRSGAPITLFEAYFEPTVGATYRLEVYRGDVVLSFATTTVPPRPRLTVGPVAGDTSSLAQTIFLENLEGVPERAHVDYAVVDTGQALPVIVPVTYGRLAAGLTEELQFQVNYGSDRYVVMAQLGKLVDEPGVRFRGLSLTFDVPSQEWADPVANNVANDLGFLGAVGRYTYEWTVDGQTVEALGWVNEQSVE